MGWLFCGEFVGWLFSGRNGDYFVATTTNVFIGLFLNFGLVCKLSF